MKSQRSVESPKQNKFKIRYVDSQLLQGYRKNLLKEHSLQKKKSKQLRLKEQQQQQNFLLNSYKLQKHHAIQTQNSTSGRSNIKRINRISSHDDMISKNQQKYKQKAQFSRVPIQYYDQKQKGNPADRIRARVVFRGYAPKNTYFYFKTIRQINQHPNQPYSSNHLTDHDLTFNSKFQSGNLIAASRINAKQYWLFMREDTNTNGLRQWYYFLIRNRKPIQIKFRIYRFSKKYSLYKEGMRPYIKAGNEWKQGGQKVKYQYDSQQACYYLQFQYNFEQPNSDTYFATLPPYSYTTLLEYLNKIKDSPYLKIRNLGLSLAGLDIPILQIKGNIQLKRQVKQGKKPAIFIMGRTHPGQTCSNYTLQAFIDRLLSHKNEKQKCLKPRLLDLFDIYIVPMVNPDGVFLGNHRTSAIGVDLNRYFFQDNLELFPEVSLVIDQVERISENQQIMFLMDLHGHSGKKNIFAYAQEHQIGEKKHLLSRIIPKLLSQSLSIFKYDYCVFRKVKQKKTTARVYFSNKFKLNSITFQQSYGLTSQGQIGITIWKNFGIALYDSLIYFHQMFNQGIVSIRDYLQYEIQDQKLKIEKRIEKQRRMLESINLVKGDVNKSLKSQIPESNTFPLIIKDIDVINQQQCQKEDSINLSEFDSEDEELQINKQQLQQLKKEIIRFGCLKQGIKREIFTMADKKLELTHWEVNQQPRVHQHKYSMAPRILKFQLKRQQATLSMHHTQLHTFRK